MQPEVVLCQWLLYKRLRPAIEWRQPGVCKGRGIVKINSIQKLPGQGKVVGRFAGLKPGCRGIGGRIQSGLDKTRESFQLASTYRVARAAH